MLAAQSLLNALSEEGNDDCLISSREGYDLKDVLDFCFSLVRK